MRGWITRPLGQVLVAAAIALGGGGIYIAATTSGGGGGGSTLFNLATFPGANGSTCDSTPTRLSTPVAAGSVPLSATACTFAQAWGVAVDNDKVFCKAGSYTEQEVLARAGIDGVQFIGPAGVERAPSTSTRCVLAEFDNFASNITFDGINLDGNGATQALFENHGDAGTNDAHDVTFKNASVGDVHDEKGTLSNGVNLTFENVWFHDAVSTQDTSHLECAYFQEVPGLIVRKSRFTNCTTFSMTFTHAPWVTVETHDVLIENNQFSCSRQLDAGGVGGTGYHPEVAFNIGGVGNTNSDPANAPLLNWVIRYNSFCSMDIDSGGSRVATGTSYMKGNVGPLACLSGFTYSYNVGSTCGGSNSVSVSPSGFDGVAPEPSWFVSEPLDNYHLTSGSAPIGAGDPADYPATDLDGVTRGNPPDAGALEFTG